MTLFEKIAAGEIPAKIIQQDEDLIVFHDINPQAPIHVLVVPKKPIPRLTGATKEDGKLLGDLLLKAQEIAKSLGIIECEELPVGVLHAAVDRELGLRAEAWSKASNLVTRLADAEDRITALGTEKGKLLVTERGWRVEWARRRRGWLGTRGGRSGGAGLWGACS